MNNDRQNLINTVSVPIVILGQDMRVEEARHLAHAVIETTSEPIVVLTAELRIQSANDAC